MNRPIRIAAGTLAATLAFGVLPTGIATAADDPTPVISIDLREGQGSPDYAATGFLHGLSADGQRPEDELMAPLKPQLFRGGGSNQPGGGWAVGGLDGYTPRWDVTVDQYNRVATPPYGADYSLVLADLWGAEGVSIRPTDPYPGDDGDWARYDAFLEQVVGDIRSADMDPAKLHLELWNEPDFDLYWPRPKAQYEQMWQRGVRALRDAFPDGRISGPTFTRITTTGDTWHMDDFLDMAVASGTAPDIVSWHDLIPGQDPVTEAQLARDLLAERGLEGVELEMNEYPASSSIDPGFNAWYIARLQRARIDYSVLAIFGACCQLPQLDGLLTQDGDDLYRTGRWWTYERYGSMTGELVSSHSDAPFDAVASFDAEADRSRILIGNAVGNGSDLGTVRVDVSGAKELRRDLAYRGKVRVRVEKIADSARADAPEVLSEVEVKPRGHLLSIDVPVDDSSASYVLTLGEQDDVLPDYAVTSTSPAIPVVSFDRPTPVAFTVRNYTDREVTLSPALELPTGYSAELPASVTVPANADAAVVASITRSTESLDAVDATFTAGDASSVVELEPTDNLARVARIEASSTISSSSILPLTDGVTDPEAWGGGGAGGWNDGTLNEFPDVVTATWDPPVELSEVTLHTLDSAGYPAPQWGVSDYDLVVITPEGAELTVAEVRGNTAGVITNTFPAVSATSLEIRILDSNSHDYSRLIEVEAS